MHNLSNSRKFSDDMTKHACVSHAHTLSNVQTLSNALKRSQTLSNALMLSNALILCVCKYVLNVHVVCVVCVVCCVCVCTACVCVHVCTLCACSEEHEKVLPIKQKLEEETQRLVCCSSCVYEILLRMLTHCCCYECPCFIAGGNADQIAQ